MSGYNDTILDSIIGSGQHIENIEDDSDSTNDSTDVSIEDQTITTSTIHPLDDEEAATSGPSPKKRIISNLKGTLSNATTG
jgi:hypothetical protein